jgi:cell surface protein SprA
LALKFREIASPQNGVSIYHLITVLVKKLSPWYDPLIQDIKLKQLLETQLMKRLKVILPIELSNYATLRIINFIGVRKQRSPEQNSTYDPENFTFSQSYNGWSVTIMKLRVILINKQEYICELCFLFSWKPIQSRSRKRVLEKK